SLSERLAEASDHTHIATEWVLLDTSIRLDPETALHVHGRVDVLLGAELSPNAALPENLWIVDYKTGEKKSLAPYGDSPQARVAALAKKLRNGEGLQLALYAL